MLYCLIPMLAHESFRVLVLGHTKGFARQLLLFYVILMIMSNTNAICQ